MNHYMDTDSTQRNEFNRRQGGGGFLERGNASCPLAVERSGTWVWFPNFFKLFSLSWGWREWGAWERGAWGRACKQKRNTPAPYPLPLCLFTDLNIPLPPAPFSSASYFNPTQALPVFAGMPRRQTWTVSVKFSRSYGGYTIGIRFSG
jgi:hypothetical protein